MDTASLPELTFNAKLLERLSSRAAQTEGKPVFFTESAQRMVDHLADTKRTFPTVLNLSEDEGATQALLPHAETRPNGQAAYSLLVANLTLTTLTDPVTTLHQLLHHVAPDGLFLATTLGAESFREFRQAFHAAGLEWQGRATPLPDVQECGTLLQRLKLAMPVADRDLITLTFPSFESMTRNLRRHASHNHHPLRQKGLLTPRQWQRVQQAYRTLFPRDDNRIPLTLELIHLHGWQPHANQQKALKPGQGKVSLVKILSPN